MDPFLVFVLKPADTSTDMAVKMATARLLAKPEMLVRAEDYNKAVHHGVVCHSCRCTVQGTSAYERNQNGLQVRVRAFFSVSAGVRHKQNCRYNVERTMDLLVARSSKITNLDVDAIPLLARDSDTKKAEFRLHIMMDCVKAGPPSCLGASSSQGVPYRVVGGHYVRSARVLKSYLNTTKSLLAFIARFEGDEPLRDQVTFRYGQRTIKWRDFFFNQNQQKELLTKLMAMDTKKEAYHPVAFVVRTRDSRVCEKLSGDTPLKLSRTALLWEGQKLSLFTTLYVGPDFLVPLLQSRDYVLVCAIPRHLRPISRITSEGQKKGWSNSLGLHIPIHSSAQVCHFRPSAPLTVS